MPNYRFLKTPNQAATCPTMSNPRFGAGSKGGLLRSFLDFFNMHDRRVNGESRLPRRKPQDGGLAMFCGHCGNESPDGSPFCLWRGASLPLADEPSGSPDRAGKKRSPVPAIAAAAALAAVASAILLFTLILPEMRLKSHASLCGLGSLHLLEGDYEQACLQFDKAIAIDGRKTAAWIGRGDASAGLVRLRSGETHSGRSRKDHG
jgi:hypothetical protein